MSIKGIIKNPDRVLLINGAIFIISCILMGVTIITAWGNNRDAARVACRATNELRNEIYVAARDLGLTGPEVTRFLTNKEDCESLP